MRMSDLKLFEMVFRNHCNDEELEAFKYTFAKKGKNLSSLLKIDSCLNLNRSPPGALTYPINYYRANFGTRVQSGRPPADVPHAPGLYLLGENDAYISKETGPLMQKEYNNLSFKIVPGVDHFLQQHNPTLVNRVMREFLEGTGGQ